MDLHLGNIESKPRAEIYNLCFNNNDLSDHINQSESST
ncbi:hypothetical protein SAMN05444385_11936 [Tritonibacter mobilis]|nr:hypothetical protein SAMN05444385_11936 [Tritonibacter mobilis]